MGRRRLVATATTALGASVAGCLDAPNLGLSDGNPSGTAAFFSLMDWGDQVGGDVVSFETPIEVGEMGHGWDPDADIVPELARNDVFLHLTTPEFQWAVDAAGELAANPDHDVLVIDGLDAIAQDDFLPFTGHDEEIRPEPDTDIAYDPEDVEVGAFEIIYGDDITAWWHDGHWHGSLPDVPVEEFRRVHLNVVDTDGNVLPLGDDAPFAIDARMQSGAPDGLLDIEISDDTVELIGQDTGQSTIVFELFGDGASLFETSNDPLLVTVAESADVELDAFYDPHVWVDPIHAQSMVHHIGEQLADRFPDNADTFRANAASYIERLAAVDDALTQVAAEAEIDVAVVVAHDAFQYLEYRYGFELHTPVGVTPDAAESIDDLARLADTIEEYRIDTILFDPFESPDPDESIPQGARVLLEDTRAEHAEPLTSIEGTTPQWREQGYGWIEQMEDVNIPSLRQALRAEK